MTEKEATGTEENVATEEPVTTESRPPVELRKGSRIRLGHRIGQIDELRGGNPPYDARIKWDDDKYFQYIVYGSLLREYELGNLSLL